MKDTLGLYNPLRYRGYVYDTESGLYYLQSRYYNPEWGRFINADALISTGQGILGNNLFAYCLNNPIIYYDSMGTRAEIWPILFGDHNPGFIHNAVRDHIIGTTLIFKGELLLPGVGRADIYDPNTNEIWEIKHGGSTEQMQSLRRVEALTQIGRYKNGASKKLNMVLQAGHAGAFIGGFVINCENISYLITYDTPEPGVVLYYVRELKTYEPAASFAYVRQRSRKSSLSCLGLVGIGALAMSACYGARDLIGSIMCTS
jgi:RHS repeat-associated protein